MYDYINNEFEINENYTPNYIVYYYVLNFLDIIIEKEPDSLFKYKTSILSTQLRKMFTYIFNCYDNAQHAIASTPPTRINDFYIQIILYKISIWKTVLKGCC